MTEYVRGCCRCLKIKFRGPLTFALSSICTFGLLMTNLGCGGPDLPEGIAISGKVTVNGQALQSGRVFYHPTGDEGKPAVGEIQSDGTFVMRTSAGIEGVVPGEYQITVSPQAAAATVSHPKDAPPPADPRKAAESPIPAKYSDARTSGLSDSVSESHSGTKEIALKNE